MKILLIFILFNISVASCDELPILKANSNILSIKEGEYLFKNSWASSPTVDLDIYTTNKFEGEIQLVFISDIDQLPLTIKPDSEYKFNVQFKNGQIAQTQIRTYVNEEASNPVLSYRNSNSDHHSDFDSINFTLGKKNRIHFSGKVNNSDPIDFIFDTGASTNVLTKNIVNTKINLNIDGAEQNNGADGISNKPISLKNVIEIDGLLWENAKFQIIDYKNPSFDAVLGWNAFEYKIIEIRYHENKLIVHKKTPNYTGYTKLNMLMLGGTPYIEISIYSDGIESKGWFGYDTGFNKSMLISESFATKNKLLKHNKIISKSTYSGSSGTANSYSSIMIDKIKLGSYEIYHFPVSVIDKDVQGIENNNYLGNELLKRFNTILDFKNNAIYIKPNDLIHEPFIMGRN